MQKGDSIFSFTVGVVSVIPDSGILSAQDIKDLSLFLLRSIAGGLIALCVTHLGHKMAKKNSQKHEPGQQ